MDLTYANQIQDMFNWGITQLKDRLSDHQAVRASLPMSAKVNVVGSLSLKSTRWSASFAVTRFHARGSTATKLLSFLWWVANHPLSGEIMICLLNRLGVTGVFFFTLSAHASLLETIPFQKSQPDVVEGKLNVPLDWEAGAEDQISLSYQIVGASHSERPFLFVFGGGPGRSSIDKYFHSAEEKAGESGYPKYFRVVILDQRGTGKSSPVEENSPELTPQIAMRYFGAKNNIRDMEALIEHLHPSAEPFYLLGHSYGGLLSLGYVAQANRLPAGVLLVHGASVLSAEPIVRARVMKQIELNRQLVDDALKAKILQAKEKLASMRLHLDPETVFLPEHLGLLFSELTSEGTRALHHALDVILRPDLNEKMIKTLFAWRAERIFGSRLTCFLSACDFLHESDTLMVDLYLELVAKGEIEDWMLIEASAFAGYLHNPQIQNFYREIDATVKTHSYEVPLQVARQRLEKVSLLSFMADQDAFVAMESSRELFEALASKPWHHLEPIEKGDHSSGLQPFAADFVAETLPKLDCARLLQTKD